MKFYSQLVIKCYMKFVYDKKCQGTDASFLEKKNPSTFRDSQRAMLRKPSPASTGTGQPLTPRYGPGQQALHRATPLHTAAGWPLGSALVQDERGAQGHFANDVLVATGHTRTHAPCCYRHYTLSGCRFLKEQDNAGKTYLTTGII